MADGNIRTENGGTENWFEEKNLMEEVKLKNWYSFLLCQTFMKIYELLCQKKVCVVGVFCGNIIQNLDLVFFL